MPVYADIKLKLWQLAHVHHYLPEIRHWLWRGRMAVSLWRGGRQGKIPVLFYLSVWGHSQFLAPVLRELRKRNPRLDYYLAVDQPGPSTPDMGSLGIPRCRIRPLRDYLPIQGFRMFVTPGQTIRHEPAWPLRVCLFHGQPSKGVNLQDETIRKFNVLFLWGPLQKDLYREFAARYPATASGLRTFDVGCPKLDALIRGEYGREDVLARIGLDPARKTVLFAPSFGKGTSMDVHGEAVFEVLAGLADQGINVAVKLHPVMYDPTVRQVHFGGKNWPEILAGYVRKPHFRDVGNVDMTPFLAASDVMVTDVSSAALDFMLLDRPVVYIDCPEFMAQIGQKGPYHTFVENPGQDLRAADVGRSAGLVVPDLKTMAAAIWRSLEHPEEFSEARRKIAAGLLFNPGRATEVATQTILDLLGGA